MQIPSKKCLGRVLLLSLCLQLQACVFTLHTWKEVPDPPQVQQASEAEREQYYQKYAIHSLSNAWGCFPLRAFNTPENPERYYDLYSYAPQMIQVYPEAEQKLKDAVYYQSAEYFTYLIALLIAAGSIIGSFVGLLNATRTAQNVDQFKVDFSSFMQTTTSLLLADLILALGFESYFFFQESQQYAEIQQGYNQALRQQLLLQPSSVDTLAPKPSLAVLE